MKNISFFILLVFLSCSGKEKSPNPQAKLTADDYYFPLKDILAGKTYTYKTSPPVDLKNKWKMKTSIVNKDTLFETTVYDNFDQITDQITERMINGKSYIHKYTASVLEFEGTEPTMVPVECEILDSLVYDPQQKISETIEWKIRHKNLSGDGYTIISKKRTLKSTEGIQKIFSDLLITDIGSQHVEIPMISIYERNKGLISYKITLPGNVIHDFVLDTIK